MNARFKVWTSTGEAVLTLRPGQDLVHDTGGLTEEGFDVTTSRYRYDGSFLYLDTERSARDCDGPLTQWRELVAKPPASGDFPDWEVVRHVNHDAFAQSMNY